MTFLLPFAIAASIAAPAPEIAASSHRAITSISASVTIVAAESIDFDELKRRNMKYAKRKDRQVTSTQKKVQIDYF